MFINSNGSGNWEERAELTASDGAESDRFGYSVAIDGDTIVIGATYDNDPTDSGAGYTFINSNGTWVEQPRFEPPDGQSYDYFGYSVATSGDTAVVGAIGPENGAGAAYVFWGLADCNANGVMDYFDIVEGTSLDCNSTEVPDECETLDAGDFDADSDVDLADFAAFQEVFTGP